MADGMIGHGNGDAAIPELRGALVGFRRWTLRGDRLGAPHKSGFFWEPGVNVATCKGMPHPKTAEFKPREVVGGIVNALLGGHVLMAGQDKVPEPVPHKNCSCGMYAYHTPAQLGHLDQASGGVLGEVAGACLLWGRIEVHQSGFRAENALPILLVRSSAPQSLRHVFERSRFDSWEQQLDAVAKRYGMSLVEPDQLLSKAAELGKLYSPDLYDRGV